MFACLVALQVFLPRILDFSVFRSEIESNLQWLTGRKVTIKSLDLHVLKGIAFVCEGVAIYEENSKEILAKTERVYLDFKILPLFTGKIEIDKIILQGPDVNLRRSIDGHFNFEGIFTQIATTVRANRQKPAPTTGRLHYLEDLLFLIHEGSGRLLDERVSRPKVEQFEINNLNLIIPNFSLEDKIPFRLSFEIPNRFPIEKTLVADNDSYVEIRGFFLNLPKDFSLEKVWMDAEVRFRSANLTTLLPYYQRFLPYRSLTGNLTLKTHFFGNLQGDFRSAGSLLLRNVKLDFPKLYPTPRTIRNGQIDFAVRLNAKRLEVNRLDLALDGIKGSVQGYVDALDDPSQSHVNFDFKSSALDISEGQRFYPQSILPKHLPKFNAFFLGDLVGGVARNIVVTFRGKTKDYHFVNFRQDMDLIGFKADLDHLKINVKAEKDGKPVLDLASGTVSLDRGTLKFSDIQGTWGDSTIHRGSGSIDHVFNDEKALLSLWIDTSLTWSHLTEILSYDIFNILPGMDKLEGNGLLESKMFIFVPIGHPQHFSLNGQIQTKNLSFSSPLKTLEFKEINTTLDFFQDQIHVPKTLFKIGDSWVLSQIDFTNYFQPKVMVSVDSDYFDFKSILKERFQNQFIAAPKGVTASPTPNPPLPHSHSPIAEPLIDRWNVEAAITIKNGKIIDLPLQNISAKSTFKKGKLTLKNLRATACDGLFSAENVTTDFHPESFGNFTMTGEFRQFNMAALKKGLHLTRPRVEGNLTLNAAISSNLLNFERLKQDLAGNLSLSGHTGEIHNLKSLANALRILNFKMFQPYQESFPFDWIHGDFTAQKGTLNTKNFLIQSPLGSVSYVGDFRLPDEHLNGFLSLHTFETSTRVLNSIPLVGSVVAWPYKGLMNTTFLVKGPNDDPNVVLVPFHELTKGIVGLFSNIIRSNPKPPGKPFTPPRQIP